MQNLSIRSCCQYSSTNVNSHRRNLSFKGKVDNSVRHFIEDAMRDEVAVSECIPKSAEFLRNCKSIYARLCDEMEKQTHPETRLFIADYFENILTGGGLYESTIRSSGLYISNPFLGKKRICSDIFPNDYHIEYIAGLMVDKCEQCLWKNTVSDFCKAAKDSLTPESILMKQAEGFDKFANDRGWWMNANYAKSKLKDVIRAAEHEKTIKNERAKLMREATLTPTQESIEPIELSLKGIWEFVLKSWKNMNT